MNVFLVLMIPFIGTSLGASAVFLMKNSINEYVQKTMLGFASGVMVAASVWSLIIPAIESSESMGHLAFLPAAVGIVLGMALLFILDKIVPHLHLNAEKPDGPESRLKKATMLVLAVTLHNIPEGMAVGAVAAGFLNGTADITAAGVMALSAGIAVQNFPEGAIISMPLKSEGCGKVRAFVYGVLSGVVEPVFAFLTIIFSSFIVDFLPYLLTFAAGAMLFVVVEELIPEASEGEHSNCGTAGFGLGFILMMILDVALG